MKLVVGSKNPAKVAAVKELCSEYLVLEAAEVVGVAVSSGVSEMPLSLKETIAGATARAENAFSDGYDLSVGLESGFIGGATAPNILLTVCVIFDGNRSMVGLSSGFVCPPKIMSFIDQGCDLQEACINAGITEDTSLGKNQGLVGILTNGRVDRKTYTQHAIRMALAQIEKKELYEDS